MEVEVSSSVDKVTFKDGLIFQPLEDSFNKVRVIEIKHGIKVEVRDYVYENLKNEKYIQDNFELNVRRLNRWWYSVYFKAK